MRKEFFLFLFFSLQAFADGHYLTAVGGGGRTTDVIHSNISYPGAYERFTLEDIGDGSSRYGI